MLLTLCAQFSREFTAHFHGIFQHASVGLGLPVKSLIFEAVIEYRGGFETEKTYSVSGYKSKSTHTLITNFNTITFSPSIVHQTLRSGKHSAFFRLGINIGSGIGKEDYTEVREKEYSGYYYDFVTNKNVYRTGTDVSTIKMKDKLSKGLAFGGTFSGGYQREIRKSLAFTSEVGVNTLKYLPGQRELVELSYNGANLIHLMENNVITYSNNPDPQNKEERNQIKFLLNSMFFNLGLKIALK